MTSAGPSWPLDASDFPGPPWTETLPPPGVTVESSDRRVTLGWLDGSDRGHPTPALERGPEGLDREVLRAIERDYPGWRPEHGRCARCAEVYEALLPTPG